MWIGKSMKATVPGSMYADLLSNHMIDDPYNRYNDIKYADYATQNWVYERSFQGRLFAFHYRAFIIAIL